MNGNGDNNSLFNRIGCAVSDWVADLSATPGAQIGVIVVCAAWFLVGWNTAVLTAVLSIMAITLTQMVLNQQKDREADAHRRDVAMHAKLDELIAASRRAKNKFVGIEDREEEEIVQLKDEVKETIEQTPPNERPEVVETAMRAVDRATEKVKRDREKGRKRPSRTAARKRSAARPR